VTSRIRRDLSWSAVGTLGMRVAGAAGGVLSARLLGPSDKGLAAVGVLVGSTVGTAATLGLQFWIIPAIAAGRSGRAVHHVLATILRRSLLVLGAVTGAALGVTLVLAPDRTAYVGAVGLLAGAWTASMLVLAVLNGRMEMRRIAVVSTIGGATNLLAMTALLVVDSASVVLVVLAAAVANGLIVPLGWSALRSLADGGAPPDGDDVARAVRFGWPNCVSELVTLAAARVDLVLVSVLLSPRDAGLYAVAVALAEGLLIVPDAVSQVLMAHVAGGTSRRDARRVAGAAGAVTAAGGLLLVVLSGWLVPTVFGAGYHGAVRALPWLVASATLAGAWKMGAAAAEARGMVSVRLRTAAAGVTALLAAATVLVPRFGIAGAGAASVCGWAVAAGLLVGGRRRHDRSPEWGPCGPVPVEVG
jgi:PST family polysaccharide transporter